MLCWTKLIACLTWVLNHRSGPCSCCRPLALFVSQSGFIFLTKQIVFMFSSRKLRLMHWVNTFYGCIWGGSLAGCWCAKVMVVLVFFVFFLFFWYWSSQNKHIKKWQQKGLVRFFGQQFVTTSMCRHMRVVYRLALHQSSVCVCVCVYNLCKLLVYYVTFVVSITVLWVLKYKICVIVYSDVIMR